MSDRTTNIKLENTSSIEINPATEEKQDSIIAAIATVGTVVVSGRKTVTASGTAESLGSSTVLTQGLIIKALRTNTGYVYIGDSSVDKNTSKQNELSAGEAVSISINNLNKVYIDSDNNGEGASYLGS